MVFSIGCSCKTAPFVECELIYVETNTTIYVPQKCKNPKTFCDEPGSIKGGLPEVLRCVHELRESGKVCK